MGPRARLPLLGLLVAGALAALVVLGLFGRGSGDLKPAPDGGSAPAAATTAPRPAEAVAPGPEGLAGVVLDTGGVPLAAAEVRARVLADDAWPAPFEKSAAARTDAVGRFEFGGLPAGDYLLEVRDDRGWGFLPRVRVRENGRTEVTVRLLPEASIRGRVVDENHEPIADAEVTTDLAGVIGFFRSDGKPPPKDVEARVRAVSDGEGRFLLARLPVGIFDLRISDADGRRRVIPGSPRRSRAWT